MKLGFSPKGKKDIKKFLLWQEYLIERVTGV
jgi:hypothetical protein